MTPRYFARSLLFLCTIAACTGDKKNNPHPVLRFSAIPDQNTTLLEKKFKPIAAYLANKLSVPVEYVPANDYTASVEMFRNGDIQLAWFGGLTGVQARHRVPGARAIAQGAEDPQYKSYFIANAATGLTRARTFPAEIADLSFVFGSAASTSGRLMPEFFIREHTGKDLDTFFVQPYAFSGAHDKTAKMVESGQVQAGVLSYKTYDALVAKGTINPEVARVIWETPTYADYNFTAHPNLDTTFGDGFTVQLQTALITMTDPSLLDAFPRSALIPANNGDFARIETVALQLDMLR
jgi:phosphonate transport system substrate-binding protein